MDHPVLATILTLVCPFQTIRVHFSWPGLKFSTKLCFKSEMVDYVILSKPQLNHNLTQPQPQPNITLVGLDMKLIPPHPTNPIQTTPPHTYFLIHYQHVSTKSKEGATLVGFNCHVIDTYTKFWWDDIIEIKKKIEWYIEWIEIKKKKCTYNCQIRKSIS